MLIYIIMMCYYYVTCYNFLSMSLNRRSQEQDTESSDRESQLEGQMNKAFESENEYEDIKLDRL